MALAVEKISMNRCEEHSVPSRECIPVLQPMRDFRALDDKLQDVHHAILKHGVMDKCIRL